MLYVINYVDGASDDRHVDKLSRVMRKPVFGVSDLVRLEPGCSAICLKFQL